MNKSYNITIAKEIAMFSFKNTKLNNWWQVWVKKLLIQSQRAIKYKIFNIDQKTKEENRSEEKEFGNNCSKRYGTCVKLFGYYETNKR